MKVRFEQFSVAGKSKINEDAAEVFNQQDAPFIAAIADGVGGNDGGGLASQIAINTTIKSLNKNSRLPFFEIFSDISTQLKTEGQNDLLNKHMATTLSVCAIYENGECKVGHAGDSRVYLLRANGIEQKTKDQTEAAVLIEAGIISKSQAKTYPRRTVLTSALSAKHEFQLQEITFLVESGDRLLLATDGVYRILSKRHLRDLSVSNRSLLDFSQSLRQSILGKNDDDATFICVEIY